MARKDRKSFPTTNKKLQFGNALKSTVERLGMMRKNVATRIHELTGVGIKKTTTNKWFYQDNGNRSQLIQTIKLFGLQFFREADPEFAEVLQLADSSENHHALMKELEELRLEIRILKENNAFAQQTIMLLSDMRKANS